MKNVIERLRAGEILVADGAMGTMLMNRGLKRGQCPESFNLKKSSILEEIAEAYFKAGAHIVQTNTFGASPLKLASYELEDDTEAINVNAVKAVRKIVGDRAYVSGSVGPTGRMLIPFGDVAPETMYGNFKRQIKALIESGVDIICVETMTDLQEAALAIKASKSIDSDIPVIGSITFDKTSRGFFTVMGVDIETAVDELESAKADIIGSNCGNGIDKMVEISREYRRFTEFPLSIQANAGIPVMKNGMLSYPETPEFMTKRIPDLIEAGVGIIGGCCGTTPEHIKSFRKLIDSL